MVPFIAAHFYIALLLLLVTFVSCDKLDPLVQFSKYAVISPRYYDVQQQPIRLDRSSAAGSDWCSRIAYIKLYDEHDVNLFTLKVFVNSQFISSTFYEQYQLNGSSQVDQREKSSEDECFFRGSISNQKLFNSTSLTNQLLALSLFRGTLNGFLSFDDKLLFVHFHDDLRKTLLFDNEDALPDAEPPKCGYEPAGSIGNARYEHVIDKRSADGKKKVHGVYQQNVQTRFVELLIVNDHKLFLDYKRDKDRLINRSKQIANVVNTLYNQLNIFIVLVGVIVWTEEDEIEITSNGDETLNRFLKYRKEKLLPQHYNDNAQLLTNITFKDNVVGKALKGPICTEDYSGGVNSDHNRLIDVVATTVSHELFHNFGGEHDPSNDSKDHRVCTCPQSKCIMSPSSGSLTPRYWSNCSIESFKDIYVHGMDSCLKNLPKESLSTTCGNGILEDDEECDTGGNKNNTCCNFKTCKLTVNSTCATGTCCNLATCQLYKLEDRKICRQSTGFCDLPEYCDGASEFCAPDIFVHNGLKCTVDGDESYCFDGKCQSHRSQCQLLFGHNAKVSIDRCFQENANNASQAANCGIELGKFGDKRFKPCKKKDIFCGRLHCLHKNKLEYGLESAATQSLISRNGTVICQTAVIDLGVGIADPGLVANGAKCGDGRMCVDQQCVPVPVSFCRYDCNGNGICNSLGQCSCFDGYHPPYCDRWSFWSSVLFFLFVCALVAVGVALVHKYKDRLQTWWIVKQRTAEIKKRAKAGTFKFDKAKIARNRNANINFDLKNLEISSPIQITDENKNHSSVQGITVNPVDYSNENINRLWESQPSNVRPELINKFVQVQQPNRIAPVRKAPPAPPVDRPPSRGSQPSNRGGQLSNQIGQPPSRGGQLPNQIGQPPNRGGQPPNQRGQPPIQSGQQSASIQSNSLCKESNVDDAAAGFSQSNQVSKIRQKFEI